MEIIVPQLETLPDGTLDIWPSLGPQIIEFLEDRFVYGPGPLKGEPYKVRDDFRYLLMRAYEHFPDGYHLKFGDIDMDMSGRRHFTEVNVSLPKGAAKTEFMALIALVELHPDAPIRFNGYDPKAPGGLAPGRSVVSPYIPMLAPTKDMLDDLAYGAAKEIASLIDDAGLFDVTNERIQIQGEADSRILPVAPNPNALDGKKPTFQCIDEPHRLYEDRHRKSYATMKNNLPKRKMDDAWQLTCTTAGDPAEPSIARDQYQQGLRMAAGKVKSDEARTFFYHRQTSDANAKFDTMGDRLRALKEASGEEVFGFRDPIPTAAMWDEAGADRSYLERVWCNRWVQSAQTAFDVQKFRALGDPTLRIQPGNQVVVGFDGARREDSTAIVVTEIDTGIQVLAGLWERPDEEDLDGQGWEVPVSEVDEVMTSIFEDYRVEFAFCDPPYWQEQISIWAGRWEGRVISWYTKNINPMYYALRAYNEAIESGDLAHNGDSDLVRHVGNAGKNMLSQYDDEGLQKYRLVKLNKKRKYDAAMAAVLSWAARMHALAKGAEQKEDPGEFYDAPQRLR